MSYKKIIISITGCLILTMSRCQHNQVKETRTNSLCDRACLENFIDTY